MKSILSTLFVFAVTSLAHGQPTNSPLPGNPKPWDRFVGCYEITQLNGKPAAGAQTIPSRISTGDSPFYTTPEGEAISAVNISIAMDDAGTDKIAAFESAFLDLNGAGYSDVGETLRLFYTGTVKDRVDGTPVSLDYIIDLAESPDRNRVMISVTKNGTLSTYGLNKKADCPNP